MNITVLISFSSFDSIPKSKLAFSHLFKMIRLVLLSLLALAMAQYNQYQPQQYNHQGGQNNNNNGAPVHYVSIGPQLQGDYKFGYNTGNDGSFREETRNPDGSVSGAYGYIDANGQKKVIRYTAGKDGFKAEGDDIPKAPPAPASQPAQQQPQQYQPQQYQPQQYHTQQYQPQQYNPQPAYYNPPQVPNYSHNYIQPQPSNGYPTYTAPQQHGSSNSQPSYNPFAYLNSQGVGQPQGNHLSQLSYSIGNGNRQQG